ncbi:MAG: FIST C-terminal domain-containing protein [Alphaproteobacteria bacterium]|nr:FIST C-terminal domain-containing protein [Alphaproteobacteria bacterium]
MAELRRDLGDGDFQHILAFYAIDHDAEKMSSALAYAFPDIPITGCSTAGEITPVGAVQGGILLVAFPRAGFRIHTGLIEDISNFGVERAAQMVRKLKSQIRDDSDRALRDRVFAMMMVDGLSNAEEPLIAAIHWAMNEIQLVGGSAGDGLSFENTSLIYDGNVVASGAALIFVECDVPFRIFKTQNFEPTATKLVVTAADSHNRIVYELNAEPAALEYATAIDLLPEDLGPFSFASYPLVVKIGGDYYCRSIRNMNPDRSLSFFCAIDEGLVFTVATPTDIVASTASALKDVESSMGKIDFVLGFECVLRRLDAENRQVRHKVEDIYQRYNVVGFHTYGEQYNAMHLNQTLTGIAFGHAS